jgi:hypothetical protein
LRSPSGQRVQFRPFMAVPVFLDMVELENAGANVVTSGITTRYALDNNGGYRLQPLGSCATLDTTNWLTSSESAPTFNLGTFNPSAGDALILLGGCLMIFHKRRRKELFKSCARVGGS